MQTIEHRSADVRHTHTVAREAAIAARANARPAPGEGMSTGTSLSPEDIRRIVVDMVG